MPTYDYKCQKCGRTFEVFQSMTSPVIQKCEKCGGKVKRLIGTGGGLIFKGSGFYATDYRKSAGSPSEPKKEKVCEPSSKDASKCAKPGCAAG